MLLALNPVFERTCSNDGTNASNIISQLFKECKHFFVKSQIICYFLHYAVKAYVFNAPIIQKYSNLLLKALF